MEIDCGKLAVHVASGLGALKGYGYEDTATAKGLQYVLDELMAAYEAAKSAEQQDTVETLTQDLDRQMAINVELLAEVEKLRVALSALPEQPDELPPDDILLDMIGAAMDDARFSGTGQCNAVLNVLRPYLRQPERESRYRYYDIEDAVRALWNGSVNKDLGDYDTFKAKYPNDCKSHGAECMERAILCAEAWGLQWRRGPVKEGECK